MTALRRSIKTTSELDKAWEPVQHDAPGEAVERLTRLLYRSPSHADFLWARGRARIYLARHLESCEEYAKALEDFRDSLLIDPSPLAKHDGILPESEWAFAVYRMLLGRCLEVHDEWMREKNRPEILWRISPAIRLASKICKAIERSDVRDDSMIDALLPFTRFESTFSMCPFRKALASSGWSPQHSGFALVTQADLDSAPQSDEPENVSVSYSELVDLLHAAAVSEEESSALHALHEELSDCSVEALLSSVSSIDRFRRAVGRFILRPFGRYMSMDTYATDLNDSHRFVRLVAIRGIGERIGELNLQHDGSEFVKGVRHLLRTIKCDRAAACRTAAVRYVGKLAMRIKSTNDVSLVEKCRNATLDAILSKSRPLVLAAIPSARLFGDLDDQQLNHLVSLNFPKRHRFDDQDDEWRLICERATTILLQVQNQDDLASGALTDLTRFLRESFHEVRLAAMQSALVVMKRDLQYRTKLRPHLLERSVIDDCKQMRLLATSALALCD